MGTFVIGKTGVDSYREARRHDGFGCYLADATDWAKAKKNIRRDEATLTNGDINKVAPYPMVTWPQSPAWLEFGAC